jgi:hypothetical protein
LRAGDRLGELADRRRGLLQKFLVLLFRGVGAVGGGLLRLHQFPDLGDHRFEREPVRARARARSDERRRQTADRDHQRRHQRLREPGRQVDCGESLGEVRRFPRRHVGRVAVADEAAAEPVERDTQRVGLFLVRGHGLVVAGDRTVGAVNRFGELVERLARLIVPEQYES